MGGHRGSVYTQAVCRLLVIPGSLLTALLVMAALLEEEPELATAMMLVRRFPAFFVGFPVDFPVLFS